MNKNKIDISVCIPTYKRPKMLLEAIKSYQAQDIQNAELIIVDDCSNDETETIVRKFQKNDPSIYYEKNKKNYGYCQNFLKTILAAKGSYLFLLGDDDLILGKHTLSKYVQAFKSNKNLGFIFSNIIQFNNQFSVDYVYRYFSTNMFYHKGKDAISNIWLKSTFAGGIGLRNRKDIAKLFPNDDVLFPLVEVIGKILLDKDAIGLENYSVGMRVHSDQLGFHMMKKKRIVGRERHATLELHEIGDNLATYVNKTKKTINKNVIYKTIQIFLGNGDKSIILSEGVKLERGVLLRNIFQSLKQEKRIEHGLIFWLQLFTVLLLPRFLVTTIKEVYRNLLRQLYWKKETQYFNDEQQRRSRKNYV